VSWTTLCGCRARVGMQLYHTGICQTVVVGPFVVPALLHISTFVVCLSWCRAIEQQVVHFVSAARM